MNRISGQDLYIALDESRANLFSSIGIMKKAGYELAQAEMEYKKSQAETMLRLHVEGIDSITKEGKMKIKPVAISACEQLSHGLEPVATNRYKRDIARINYESSKEKIYAIRKEINILEKEIWGELKQLNG